MTHGDGLPRFRKPQVKGSNPLAGSSFRHKMKALGGSRAFYYILFTVLEPGAVGRVAERDEPLHFSCFSRGVI